MVGESFEPQHKREFGDDPRDAEHFARFRKLNEQRIAWLRKYVAQKAEEVWVVRCFDSPTEFVRRFPDAAQREEMLYESENFFHGQSCREMMTMVYKKYVLRLRSA